MYCRVPEPAVRIGIECGPPKTYDPKHRRGIVTEASGLLVGARLPRAQPGRMGSTQGSHSKYRALVSRHQDPVGVGRKPLDPGNRPPLAPEQTPSVDPQSDPHRFG